MNPPAANAAQAGGAAGSEIGAVLAQINRVILGKEAQIRLAWPACWRAAIC